ncbi:MAG: tRNA modification GTPase [Myxococcota bacterium]|jgi:tRNA modification GTPase
MAAERDGREPIVALATPWGRSALAVVRLSGAGLPDRVCSVVRVRRQWAVGRPRRVDLADADGVFDDGVAVLAAPTASYTGEATLEITCHGNPLIVERVIAALQGAGVRLAEPGEFTRRAVENGKLDLVAAEAVDQVCRATTAAGLQVARDALDGRLGAHLVDLRGQLLDVAAELEARLDYPGDELALEDDDAVRARLEAVRSSSASLASTCGAGRVLVEGARVALVGPVNVGKSSLFNRLVGRTRAIVADQPGTTRDVVESRCTVGGLAVTLLDTAGERETLDAVEAAGQALARELVGDADLLLVVARAGRPDPVVDTILARTEGRRRLVVYNAVDTAPAPPGELAVSAATGEGIPALRAALVAALVGNSTRSDQLRIASARQRDALLELAAACEQALGALGWAGPAVASDAVTRGLESLDALTGADTREDVLSAVFRRFCIGK